MSRDQLTNQLAYIEDRCKAMRREAGKIQEMLEFMKGKPHFETLCHDEIKRLACDITMLSAFMKASLEHYDKLPEVA